MEKKKVRKKIMAKMVETKTKVDDCSYKMDRLKEQAASVIAENCIDRMKNGNYKSLDGDLHQLLMNFPAEYKVDILIYTIQAIIKNQGMNGKKRDDDDVRDFDDLFKSRGF